MAWITHETVLIFVSSCHSRTVWEGGTESHTFNRLEEIALEWGAKTPVLGSRISRVLESKVIGADYLPSRINWVVQVLFITAIRLGRYQFVKFETDIMPETIFRALLLTTSTSSWLQLTGKWRKWESTEGDSSFRFTTKSGETLDHLCDNRLSSWGSFQSSN